MTKQTSSSITSLAQGALSRVTGGADGAPAFDARQIQAAQQAGQCLGDAAERLDDSNVALRKPPATQQWRKALLATDNFARAFDRCSDAFKRNSETPV